MALAATSPQPLIPEKYLDAPSQRLYYLSLGLLCQVRVVFSKLAHLTSSSFRQLNSLTFFGIGPREAKILLFAENGF